MPPKGRVVRPQTCRRASRKLSAVMAAPTFFFLTILFFCCQKRNVLH